MSLVAARLKVPAGLDRLSDLAVEVLDAVGGVDRAAQVGGQREERGDVVSALTPGVGDHRVALAPRLVERLEGLLGGVGVDGAVDRPASGSTLASPRRTARRPAHEALVHCAAALRTAAGATRKGGTGGRPCRRPRTAHREAPCRPRLRTRDRLTIGRSAGVWRHGQVQEVPPPIPCKISRSGVLALPHRPAGRHSVAARTSEDRTQTPPSLTGSTNPHG